jgi:transcriptional regulator with XRE-family HTH domain
VTKSNRWDTRPYTKLRVLLLRPEARPNYVLAARLGVAPSRLSDWSLGKRVIPTDKLMMLCEILRVAPDDIIGELDPVDADVDASR